MQPPESAAAAWRVFLKHTLQVPDLQADALSLCCQLMCCSQSMAVLVHGSCRGTRRGFIPKRPAAKPTCGTAAYKVWQQQAYDHGASIGSWLAKHAVLLHQLELDIWPEQEASVAAGLCAAAAVVISRPAPQLHAAAAAQTPPVQNPSLPLLSLSCLSASTGRLLRAASGAALTHLSLQEGAAAAQQRIAALASLTSLKSLVLKGSWCSQHPLPVLGPALRHLTQLTALAMPRVQVDSDVIRLLPTSLMQLTICCHSKPLRMQQLSALRSLHLEQQLHADEALPQSLSSLWLGSCNSVRPLLALTQLQWLRIDSDFPAEQLQELAGMTQLQELQLTYFCQQLRSACGGNTLAEASGHLSTVPLKQLKVLGQWGSGQLPATVLCCLCALTQLTALSLQDLAVQGTPQQLAAQLQPMSSLQKLELRSLSWQESVASEGSGAEGIAGLEHLAVAVAGMSSLREVSWSGMTPEAADCVTKQLNAATQLTAFDVGAPRIDIVINALQKCC